MAPVAVNPSGVSPILSMPLPDLLVLMEATSYTGAKASLFSAYELSAARVASTRPNTSARRRLSIQPR